MVAIQMLCGLFQSTLPARGATTLPRVIKRRGRNFNPRSPPGELPSSPCPSRRQGHFNPRSPHGERQMLVYDYAYAEQVFQSTLPARGATRSCGSRVRLPINFNPRSPHGERPRPLRRTPSARPISIHAPRTGSDAQLGPVDAGNGDFNPRSPHGERRLHHDYMHHRSDFNPRSPHGERQRKVTILSIRIIGFAQKVYHKTVLLRISLAENAVILPKRPQNPVRTSLQKAGGLRFARAIRAARPYSISSPSGA